MAKRLVDNVLVDGKWHTAGTLHDEVPEAARRQLGDHMWTEDDGAIREAPAIPDATPSPEEMGDQEDVITDVPPAAVIRQGAPEAGPVESQPKVPVQRSAPSIEGGSDVAPDAGETSPGTTAPAPDGEGDADLDPPPLSGPGSSLQDWLAYAELVGVEVPADAKRADVIEAVRAAGKPVE
jgi:hypothetical protein